MMPVRDPVGEGVLGAESGGGGEDADRSVDVGGVPDAGGVDRCLAWRELGAASVAVDLPGEWTGVVDRSTAARVSSSSSMSAGSHGCAAEALDEWWSTDQGWSDPVR